jgi:exopolysaccharide biosynthesis protein
VRHIAATILLTLILACVSLAEESFPRFENLTDGLEYREVKIDQPRPLTILQLRCDPTKVRFNLLLATDLKSQPSAATASQVAEELGQIAVINSSYFGHNLEVLGYTERLGHVLNDDLPSGIFSAFFYWDGRRAGFKRRDESRPKNVPVLFQAGPRLVWDGQPVEGLDTEALANRTVLTVDKEGRVGVVVFGGLAHATLAELPTLLSRSVAKGGLDSVRALNLDGGSSTQFYLRSGKLKKSLPGRVKVPVFLGISRR